MISVGSVRTGNNHEGVWGVLVVLFIGLLLFAISSCLPLWQRVFIHQKVIRIHMARSKVLITFCIVILVLYALFGLMGFHHWQIGIFSGLAIGFMALAFCTLGVGRLQLMLSERYIGLCAGNGYGLLNLFCIFSDSGPSHIYTYLQDSLWIAATIFSVNQAPDEGKGLVLIFCSLLCATVVGYNWFCQVKFAESDLIDFAIIRPSLIWR